jgi:ring-1,2-phenylacetyl-CoA epoxidase subunit PaaE
MSNLGTSAAQSAASEHATYVALAVGAGLSTLLPLITARLAKEPACRVLVFYGNYDERSDLDVEALLALKDCHLQRLALHFVMAREAEEGELLNGRLTAQKLRDFATQLFDPQSVQQYFVAGPASLVAELRAELQTLGVAAARIVGGEAAVAPTAVRETEAAAAPAAAGVTQVAVVMDGRRRSFSMQTGSESILDAAARAGIELPFSCRAGVCSTCRTKLVRGEVELAQNYALEDWELAQGFILACQAHAKTAELEITYDET